VWKKRLKKTAWISKTRNCQGQPVLVVGAVGAVMGLLLLMVAWFSPLPLNASRMSPFALLV